MNLKKKTNNKAIPLFSIWTYRYLGLFTDGKQTEGL